MKDLAAPAHRRQRWPVFVAAAAVAGALAAGWLWRPAALRSDAAVAIPAGMRLIPGGEFTMGSNDEIVWPEERPAHKVRIAAFLLDETEVTNAQFTAFVTATQHLTQAERKPDLSALKVPPGMQVPPELFEPGGMVFKTPSGPVDLRDLSQWWAWVPGAQWRHPRGPGSNLDGLGEHPVVQIAWDDAKAFCSWAGKRLPTEAEWERAARGGQENLPYVWGDGKPNERSVLANLWQGRFPERNTASDGFETTAPVRSFQPNGYGLYDMAGNVWEWNADWYDRRAYARRSTTDVTDNPTGPAQPMDPEARRAQRGGSFLCHDSYCSRYRPSARQGAPNDIGTSHSGFRCAKSVG